MGEAKRRKPVARQKAERMGRALNADAEAVEIKGDMAELCAGTAAYLLEGSVDRTPCLVRSSGSRAMGLRRGVGISSSLAAITRVKRDTISFSLRQRPTPWLLRSGVKTALVAHPPCVLHDFDDELRLAKLAEILWPCAKITGIRQSIEAERTAWKAAAAACGDAPP
jgi:hypothetical protein